MRTDYAERFRDTAVVSRYDRVVYAPGTYSSAINARQHAYLRRLADRAFPDRRPVQHDFACGTGRAIRLLHGVVRAAHGYDSSAAMLATARNTGVYARLHEVAESGPVPEPADMDGPKLVTIFRLLLNTSPAVRDRAVAFAARALPHADSGLLVLENHGNRSSLRHLGHRRNAGNPWFSELAHGEVERLLHRHGFRIVERRGFAICPAGSYRRRWLRPLAQRFDDLTVWTPLLSGVATDVLYVARRVR